MLLIIRLVFILSLIWMQNSFADLSLTREDCPSIDYSNNFNNRERDQDGHNVCWGFVAAGLLEEELCLSDSAKCGVALSVLDTMRSNWSLGASNEMRDVEKAVEYGIKNGVCPEESAPFQEGNTLLCRFLELTRNRGVKCLTNKLKDLYETFSPKIYEDSEVCTNNLPMPASDMISYLYQVSQISDSLNLEEGEAMEALMSSKEEADYLKQMLVPNACKNTRLNFTGAGQREATTNFLVDTSGSRVSQHNLKEKFLKVKSILQNGRSLGLGLCSKELKAILKGDKAPTNIFNPLDKTCGNHGLIIQGMRWNQNKNTCELKVKNSWGDDSLIQGWIGANEILSTSFLTVHLE